MRAQRLSQPDPPPAVTWRRRLSLLAVVLVAAGVAITLGSRVGSGAPPPKRAQPKATAVQVVAGDRVALRISLRRNAPPDVATVRRLLAGRLPRRAVAARGRARISYRYDAAATARRVLRLAATGRRVQAVRIPVSSRIRAPVVRQFERNTCEAAALQVLLATTGSRVDQRRLQSAFRQSGPLDPEGTGPQRTWGDPDLGYVGRPDGGGAAGGFGIYPGPVAAAARTFGRQLDDLTASDPQRVYARLRRGRAVMVWIGLSDGPYEQWRSPQGKHVRVNFGEHTIVLTGITVDGTLRVVNPLQGTLESWSRARFEAAWKLLGRRALGA